MSMEQRKYMPISCRSLRSGTVLTFNAFEKMKTPRGDKYILLLPKNTQISRSHEMRFADNNVRMLYVAPEEVAVYRHYINQNLKAILADETVSREDKAQVLYDAAQLAISNVFSQPSVPGPLREAAGIVSHITMFILGGRKAFIDLFKQSLGGFYIYGHSAKVCVYSLALARKIGINNPKKLLEIGLGAFLHDVGMRKLPRELFLKPGHLSDDEWSLIRRHPHLGSHIITSTQLNSDNILSVVRQHHEKLDGSGYPWGIKKQEIHPYAKLTSIADIFDALTSVRPYRREVLSTFDALRKMRYNMVEGMDQNLLEHFIRMMAK